VELLCDRNACYKRPMVEYLQVLTTTATKQDAERIATELVAERLAACVQVVGPITSVYRWQGEMENSQEWLCLAKTTRQRYEAVEIAIRRLHPYDVPEVIATPIVAGSAAYLDWVADELRDDAGPTSGPVGES